MHPFMEAYQVQARRRLKRVVKPHHKWMMRVREHVPLADAIFGLRLFDNLAFLEALHGVDATRLVAHQNDLPWMV
jgi:hypothetical protein